MKRFQNTNSFISFLRGLVVLLIWGFIYCQADAQSYSQLIFDQHQSEYFGAHNLSTLHHALYSFEDRFLPDTILKKNRFPKRFGNFGYRLVKLYFLDAQFDGFIALMQHEIFGHGARYREFGYKNNSFNLNLYPPFGDASGFAMRGTLRPTYKSPTYQENIAIHTSGVEAEMLLANNIAAEILLNDTVNYRQGLLFLIAQNNELLYLWSTRLTSTAHINAGNDMNNYINDVNYFYSKPGIKGYDINQLSNQSIISLANPIQVYAAFAIVYSYLIKCRKQMNKIPMIRLGRLRYLPAFNYSLTPFGSRFHFVNYLRFQKMLFSCDFNMSDKHFRDFYGIAFKGYNIINQKWITINAHAEFWNQPILELNQYTMPVSMNKAGGGFKVDILFRPVKLPGRLGLFVETGYKTKGYMDGEVVAESFILRYGLSVHL
jgi:hypothetical protein